MSYENYLSRKETRNRKLMRYHQKYPQITQKDLARIFKLSQSRVSRILMKAAKTEATDDNRN